MRFGLGTYRTFDLSPGAPAEAEASRVLKAFYDAGGRFIDSSPMYGQAEACVGRLSTQLGLNQDLFIATKVWTQGQAEGQRQMKDSIGKLGRKDGLELMQVHNLVDWQAHWPTLEAWKAKGRFRAIGITHYQPAAFGELERVIKSKAVDYVQFPYNLLVAAAEERLLSVAADHGVKTIANEPFGQGALFKQVQGKALPAWVKADLGIQTWSHYALAWILSEPRISVVIPATGKLAHWQEMAPALKGSLPTKAQRERMAQELR